MSLADAARSWWVALDHYRTAGDVESLEHMLACRADLDVALHEPHVARAMERLALDVSEQLMLTLLLVSGEADVHALLTRTAGPLEPATSSATLARMVLGPVKFAAALTSFSSHGRLRRLAIIERCDAGGPNVHETRWAWILSRRVFALLHGETFVDDSACVRAVEPEMIESGELALSDRARRQLEQVNFTEHQIVVCTGLPGLGKRTAAKQVCAARGIHVVELRAADLDKEPARLASQLRAIAREVLLEEAVLIVARIDEISDDSRTLFDAELFSNVTRTIVMTTGVNRPSIRSSIPVRFIDVDPPVADQLAILWKRVLSVSDADSVVLANRYPLAPSLVVKVAEVAKRHSDGRALAEEDVYQGLQAVTDLRLREHARRLTVTQSWSDLVLSHDQVTAIRELIARVRHRTTVYERWGFGAKVGKGLGVSALFSGPPGTGKSMVAGLIAKDLGLELYQVDAAKIVSKWVGETEKQLAALFDVAEAAHAVLLFDEADSLFGKRTEVKSSNDRYANLETNYLLQRMENYTGIVLLTSNHESNIDPAFQRRLSLHLRFAMPDVVERELLWKAMIPTAAPVDGDVDFVSLSHRYVMSGGYIRNAALRAAFMAAGDSAMLDQERLERAARSEYEGMGKLTFA